METSTLITLVGIFITLIALIGIYFTVKTGGNLMILKLAPIGTYTTPHNTFDLREYMVDQKGNLYSVNLDTWEINKNKRRHVLRCSDGALTRQGEVINSLRDVKGKKATIRRKNLNFEQLARRNGSLAVIVEATTPRHYSVKVMSDFRREDVKATVYTEGK